VFYVMALISASGVLLALMLRKVVPSAEPAAAVEIAPAGATPAATSTARAPEPGHEIAPSAARATSAPEPVHQAAPSAARATSAPEPVHQAAPSAARATSAPEPVHQAAPSTAEPRVTEPAPAERGPTGAPAEHEPSLTR
jgi:hypothetical protein